jgi:hypothetical protein
MLFTILAANGLACVSAIPELDFLGHCISAAGIAPSGTTSKSFWISLNQSYAKISWYDEFLSPFPPWRSRHTPPAHRPTRR